MSVEELSDLSDVIAHLGRPHEDVPLLDADLDPDPMAQFATWLRAALDARLAFPNAMTLATASVDGAPSARTVLLKGVDDTGFVFFTNYESPKAKHLDENPRAALLFYWFQLERQVRVTGTAERISEAESDAYFAARPRGSQLGAWASRQSEVLPDRRVLDQRIAELDERYGDVVPRPPFWGGYRVVPAEMEFWQGRSDRLHDRHRYRRGRDGWVRERLSP